MNDKNILRALSILKEFDCWEEPTKISDELQGTARTALSEILSLLKSAKPDTKPSFHSYYFDYIPNLYQAETEIKKGCYYNACYELYCLTKKTALSEKQITLNVIDVLEKNLSGGADNALEQEKSTI